MILLLSNWAYAPVIKIPELIERYEMEFHAALKKAMGCMGIQDMKTKHSKSIEKYLVRILSIHRELSGGILLFPCPLDMPNVLYLLFLLCCLTDAFNLNRFLPCSAILAYQL